jgi:imidazolonepropionase-like amidohydrolase
MAAIQSATVTTAELLGIQEDVGTLEKGKLADVIAVKGDPLADIALFQDNDKIALVMQSGVVVKGEL